jgi:hypothetical protein
MIAASCVAGTVRKAKKFWIQVMKQNIAKAFFVVIWSGLLPVDCFGVEITLNELINEQHIQDQIESGALRDGN